MNEQINRKIETWRIEKWRYGEMEIITKYEMVN